MLPPAPNHLLSRLAFIVCGAAILGGTFLLRQHYLLTLVVGESMTPTLRSGQILLIDRFAYRNNPPQRGDVVVAARGSDLVVKRIVGLPGEIVEVRQGIVYVDGFAQRENYPVQPGLLDVGKGKLFDNDYATLGDNRSVPSSIAIHPVVSPPDIIGKVVRTLFKLP